MLKLFYAPNACALAPHIALNEAGADFDLVKVDTPKGEQRAAEYLAINPKSRVPALATDRGILTEVPVLLGYIARNFPKAELAPSDGFEFFQMQSFNLYLASTIHITFAHLFRPERYADSDAGQGRHESQGGREPGEPAGPGRRTAFATGGTGCMARATPPPTPISTFSPAGWSGRVRAASRPSPGWPPTAPGCRPVPPCSGPWTSRGSSPFKTAPTGLSLPPAIR